MIFLNFDATNLEVWCSRVLQVGRYLVGFSIWPANSSSLNLMWVSYEWSTRLENWHSSPIIPKQYISFRSRNYMYLVAFSCVARYYILYVVTCIFVRQCIIHVYMLNIQLSYPLNKVSGDFLYFIRVILIYKWFMYFPKYMFNFSIF